MSGGTYVVVTDDRWRFDPEAVFAALAQAYVGLPVKRQGSTMNAYGWEVTVLGDLTTFSTASASFRRKRAGALGILRSRSKERGDAQQPGRLVTRSGRSVHVPCCS